MVFISFPFSPASGLGVLPSIPSRKVLIHYGFPIFLLAVSFDQTIHGALRVVAACPERPIVIRGTRLVDEGRSFTTKRARQNKSVESNGRGGFLSAWHGSY